MALKYCSFSWWTLCARVAREVRVGASFRSPPRYGAIKNSRPNLRFIHTSNVFTQTEKYTPEIVNTLVIPPTLSELPDHDFCTDEMCKVDADGRKNHFSVLMSDLFNLSAEELQIILADYPLLWKDFLHKTLYYLGKFTLEKRTLLHHPWLLSVPPAEIDKKLGYISEKFPDLADINICCVLLNPRIQTKKLSVWLRIWQLEGQGKVHPSKFHYLSAVLEAPSITHLLECADHKPFLWVLSYAKTIQKTEFMLEAGISKQHLLADLRFLVSSLALMKKRLDETTKAGLPFKTWLLRIPPSEFGAYIRKQTQLKSLVDLETYLTNRLQCSPAVSAYIVKAYGMSSRTQCVLRVSKILDYLLIEKGLDPQIIVANPGCLRRTLEFVKSRVEQLLSVDSDLDQLFWVVVKPNDVFDHFMNRYRNRTSVSSKTVQTKIVQNNILYDV